MGKLANCLTAKNKIIADQAELIKNSIPVDQADRDELAKLDDQGNPVPPSDPQPTIDDVTAKIKEETEKLAAVLPENTLPAAS